MPAGMSVFDYSWELPPAPEVGMLVQIPFRKKILFGIISELPLSTAFTVRPIPDQTPVKVLSTPEVAWLTALASELNSTIGNLARYSLPSPSKRTYQALTRTELAEIMPREAPTAIKCAWYFDAESHDAAVLAAMCQLAKSKRVIALVAPSNERAEELVRLLSGHRADHEIIHYHPESAPRRRAAWLAWTGGSKKIILVGTHALTWLPFAGDGAWAVDEPTHPFHTQWDGINYDNRQILESRRINLGDSVTLIGHSPHTLDLNRIATVPSLATWPTIVDRTAEEPRNRRLFLSPVLEDAIERSQRLIFFVPHLREATHALCKDCGALQPFETVNAQAQCVTCSGTQFLLMGLGAQSLVRELRELAVVNAADEIILADARSEQLARATEAVEQIYSTEHRIIVIATAPLAYSVDLGWFDTVIDLSPDFELIHPHLRSEESIWNRLRAMSTRLPRAWAGAWYVQTRRPALSAWSVRDFDGFTRWWISEKVLRKRFNQAPYGRLDFLRK